MQVTLILSRKSRGATNMSTAEYLISSYDGSSAAHHFSFSRKKNKKKTLQYTAAINQNKHTKLTQNELETLHGH